MSAWGRAKVKRVVEGVHGTDVSGVNPAFDRPRISQIHGTRF